MKISKKPRGIVAKSSLLLGDALSLPFKDEIFDVAIAIEVIEHVINPIAFLREMKRVIKEKRFLVLTFPDALSWHPLYALVKHLPTKTKRKRILTPFIPGDDPSRSRQPIDHAYTLKDIINFADKAGLRLMTYQYIKRNPEVKEITLSSLLGNLYSQAIRKTSPKFSYRKLLIFQKA